MIRIILSVPVNSTKRRNILLNAPSSLDTVAMEPDRPLPPHHIALPNAALRGAICSSCFKGPASGKRLLACGRCTLARYCGQQCQKDHWGTHKHDCSKLAADLKNPTVKHIPQYSSQVSLMSMRWSEVQELEFEYDRALNINEQKFLLYRPYCQFCFKVRGPSVELLTCDKCHHHSRCKDCEDSLHPPHTPETCAVYQLSNEQDLFTFQHHVRFGRMPLAWAGETRLPASAPLPADWDDYFTSRGCMSELVPPQLMVAFTRQSSLVLTTLLGLHRVLSPEELETKKELVVHLLGAEDGLEFPATMAWEEILHMLPSLRSLRLVCVGPGVNKGQERAQGEERLECCPDCEGLGATRVVEFYRGMYHDYAHTKHYKRPDLALAFNSGMHEDLQGSWTPTLLHLTKEGTPFLFTSFNANEAQSDADVMQSLGARLQCREVNNPFKDRRPRVDDEYGDRFYYINFQYGLAMGKLGPGEANSS